MNVEHRNGFTCEDAEDRITDLENRAEAAEREASELREQLAAKELDITPSINEKAATARARIAETEAGELRERVAEVEALAKSFDEEKQELVTFLSEEADRAIEAEERVQTLTEAQDGLIAESARRLKRIVKLEDALTRVNDRNGIACANIVRAALSTGEDTK